MNSKTIVLLLQDEGGNRGEVNEFDDPQDAERYLTALLEAGVERASIRVLSAQDLDLLVTQKPVVSLLSDESPAAPAVEVSREPVRVAAGNEGVAAMQASEVPAAPEPAGKESEPYTQNGVRFSSAFNSDY